MSKLDEVALNIELVLISVIAGVAFVKFAEYAIPVLAFPLRIFYVPYVLAGLSVLLVFWSQAILHAVTFIRWPLQMGRMFLYFVAAFLQIVAYSAMTNPAVWFFWWTLFTVVTYVIYRVDLSAIDEMKRRYDGSEPGEALVRSVRARHRAEMRYLVPIAFVTNLLATVILFRYQSAVTVGGFGVLSLLVSLYAVSGTMKEFATRAKLIAHAMRETR